MDKFALVTGASTGIGRMVAIELSKNDYFVYLNGTKEEKIKETQSLLTSPGKSQIILADLSNPNSTDTIFNAVKKQSGYLNVLVNVAGIWHGDSEVYAGLPLEKFNRKVILDTMNVGLTVPILMIRDLIPVMQQGSSIINISGTFENGGAGWLPYYVSKRGLEDLTFSLSEELKDKEIFVNCVSPSDTATEEYKKYFPEDSLGANSPQDVADAVLSLINSNTTGQFVVIKKGIKTDQGFHK